MGAIESVFLMVGKWFGYVGACMFVPDATCRPFLAFVALGAAACAALILVLMAYRSARQREASPAQEIALHEDTARVLERARRTAPEPRIAPQRELPGRLRAA